MTIYNFEDERARKLWDRAAPKGHYNAFAWRESPGAVDNAWKKIMRKMSTNEEKDKFLDECIRSAEIQARDRKRQSDGGDTLNRPVGLAVWLNNGRWGDEVGSAVERPKQALGSCKCGKEIIGPRFKHCARCLPSNDSMVPLLRKKYKEMGLQGKTVDELRVIFKQSVRRILNV